MQAVRRSQQRFCTPLPHLLLLPMSSSMMIVVLHQPPLQYLRPPLHGLPLLCRYLLAIQLHGLYMIALLRLSVPFPAQLHGHSPQMRNCMPLSRASPTPTRRSPSTIKQRLCPCARPTSLYAVKLLCARSGNGPVKQWTSPALPLPSDVRTPTLHRRARLLLHRLHLHQPKDPAQRTGDGTTVEETGNTTMTITMRSARPTQVNRLRRHHHPHHHHLLHLHLTHLDTHHRQRH